MDAAEMYCAQCGIRLDGFAGAGRADGASPCPGCGCTSRTFQKTLEAGRVGVASDVTAHGTSGGKDLSVRRVSSDAGGRYAAADRHNDGSLRHALGGSPPQGEETTEAACRTLVGVLNHAGANWNPPRKPQEGAACGVDCVAVDRGDQQKVLAIQVVRADIRQSFWRRLAKTRRVEDGTLTTAQLVARLKDAVKLKERAIPPRDRRRLTLALDATWLPAYSMDAVVAEFRSQFGPWTRERGFDSVWVVGPSERLTRRLDVST